MKKYNYIPAILLLPMLCAPGAQAEDNEVSGFVMPSFKSVHMSGQKGKSAEYSDSDSSISGSAEIKSENDTGYVTFSADEIGQDTQNYKAEGGQYGKFKLDAFYNETQHNNTSDANSIMSGGVGTNHLVSPLTSIVYATPPPSPATAGTLFDYEVSRNQYGAGLRLDLLKPFFANFSVSQEKRDGIKPIGSSLQIELPEPVDYKTNTMQAEVGYGKDPYFASLGYTHSRFDNAYDALYFTNIYTTAAFANESVTLPPDNSYNKFDLKGRVKMPLKSTLALGYSTAKAESEANLTDSYKAGGANKFLTPLTDHVFNGRVDTTNYSAVLTSSPLDFLDGKLFYKNYATKNKSDEISIVQSGTDYSNTLFDYTKKSYGIEAGLKLPGHVTLTPSYTNMSTVLPDDITTEDKTYGINAKWKGTDFVAANMGYERMNRDGHSQTSFVTTTTFPNVLDPYVRMYDTASQKRDIYKFGIDVFPTDMLSLGFTAKHKNIDYNETAVGLTGERGNTFGASATLTPNDTVSVNAYVDYEISKLKMLQRYGATTTANADPGDGNPADASFNIDTTQNDKSLDWGLGVDVKAIPKILTLRAQYDHTRSNGYADFTYAANSLANNGVPAGWNNDNSIDFSNWDDYKKDSLLLKGTYSLSSNVDLTGGYAYEKYRYNDGQYDNYQYVYRSSSTAVGYLSGANANPDYTANMVFLSAKYKF